MIAEKLSFEAIPKSSERWSWGDVRQQTVPHVSIGHRKHTIADSEKPCSSDHEVTIHCSHLTTVNCTCYSHTQWRIQGGGGHGAMSPPIIRDLFLKYASDIFGFDYYLSNETITFINWSCICRLANLEFTYLLINFYFGFTLNSASLIYMCRAVGNTFCRV